MLLDDIRREPIEWCDIWVRGCKGTELPRLLLIGDSITKSYFPFVDNSLKNRYCCGRLTTSKCVGDPGLLKELDIAFCDNQFDVIHFNNGMHGWDYTEEQYAAGLEETLDWIIQAAPNARLIWAHTTPRRRGEGFAEFDNEITGRVKERNRIAALLSEERKLEINDLFSVVAYRPELFSDGVHFTPEGQSELGQVVVRIIDPPSDL